MISKKSTFFLGIFIFLVPYFGLTSAYRTTLIIICGITLMLLSIKIPVPKKSIKARVKREKVTEVFSESIPLEPKISPIQMREIKRKESVDKVVQ